MLRRINTVKKGSRIIFVSIFLLLSTLLLLSWFMFFNYRADAEGDTIPPWAYVYSPYHSSEVSATQFFNVNWGGNDTESYSSGLSNVKLYNHDQNSTDWVLIDERVPSTPSSGVFTSTSYNGQPGYSYYFKSVATDNAGNVGESMVSTTRVPHDQDVFTYSGAWSNVNDTNLYLGSAKYSSTKNNYIQYTVPSGATQIYLIMTYRSNGGKADVYLNGIKNRTIDLYASNTLYRRTVWGVSVDPSTMNTVKVVVTGSKSPSSSGRRVEIDGLCVSR